MAETNQTPAPAADSKTYTQDEFNMELENTKKQCGRGKTLPLFHAFQLLKFGYNIVKVIENVPPRKYNNGGKVWYY